MDAYVAEIAKLVPNLENVVQLLEESPAASTVAGLGLVTVVSLGCVVLLPGKLPRSLLSALLSLALGVMLGDVFLHGLPEHFCESAGHHGHEHEHGHGHGHGHGHHHNESAWLTLAGMGLFMVFERVAGLVAYLAGGHSHHDHGHDHTEPSGHGHDHDHSKTSGNWNAGKTAAFVVSSAAHAFGDGVSLASAFYAGRSAGTSTLLALLMHETPHRLGEFTLLVAQGFGKLGALATILVASLGGWLGAALVLGVSEGYFTSMDAHEVGHVQSTMAQLATGGMLYMAMNNVLPEVLHAGSSGCFFARLRSLIIDSACLYAGVHAMSLITH